MKSILQELALGIIQLLRTQNIQKTNISDPLVLGSTAMCTYCGVRNKSFSEYFVYMLIG